MVTMTMLVTATRMASLIARSSARGRASVPCSSALLCSRSRRLYRWRSSSTSGSVALLADLIHNFGDALTAIPLGIAFWVRSAKAERWAGYFVVLVIFVSACVALYETIVPTDPPANGLPSVGAGGSGRRWFRRQRDRRLGAATGGPPAQQPGACRRRLPRSNRRTRLARGRRQRRTCRARSGGCRSADRPRDHTRHPPDHLAVVADDPTRSPRALKPRSRRSRIRSCIRAASSGARFTTVRFPGCGTSLPTWPWCFSCSGSGGTCRPRSRHTTSAGRQASPNDVVRHSPSPPKGPVKRVSPQAPSAVDRRLTTACEGASMLGSWAGPNFSRRPGASAR